MLPDSVKCLIDNFKLLPGIGSKSAERLVFSLLDFDKEKLTNFSKAILEVRDKICKCEICGSISDDEFCSICKDKGRDCSIILIVEKSKDILLFEKLGNFKGYYHVLNGLISPLDGVGPEDISLRELISRLDSDEVKEIVFALKPSIESETTMQYICKILSDKNIKISKLATGVPIGTDIEYIDSLTLEFAIDERKKMN